MIVSFTISEPRPLTEEELAHLNTVVVEDLEQYPQDHEYEYQRGKLKGYNYTGHLEDVLKALPKGFSASIDGQMPLTVAAALLSELRHISGKFQLLDKRDEAHPQQHNRMHNDNHIASESLLRVRETRIMDDCCTESLDAKLEEGWRLLAVCPQPDQRRPDYIIGRFHREDD